MTSAWSITKSASAPRAVFTDFPLGNTAGPPHEPVTQLAIARSALEQVNSTTVPGTITALDHEWATAWKHEARELKDHRTERHGTPQYQEPEDRIAAVEKHGENTAVGEISES